MLQTADISQLMRSETRCIVCGLPMPRGDDGDLCSRRCAGRKAKALELQTTHSNSTKKSILDELHSLREGVTICPGELSQRILPGVENPLHLLRPLLFSLQEEGHLRLSQKGTITPWRKLRGPFRVGGKK